MKEQINLFRPDLIEGAVNAGTFRKKQWVGASIGICFVLLVVFYVQDEKKQILLKREVDAILQQREQLQQQMAVLTPQGLLSEQKKSGGLDFLTEEAMLKERVTWSSVLVEVSRVVPEGVWITVFENNAAKEVRFDGFAASYQKVTELMSSLEASSLFQDVLLDFSRQGSGERKIDFSIQARLKPSVTKSRQERG